MQSPDIVHVPTRCMVKYSLLYDDCYSNDHHQEALLLLTSPMLYVMSVKTVCDLSVTHFNKDILY